MHFKKYSEHTSKEIVSFSRVMAVAFVVIATVVAWLKDWELTSAVTVLASIGGAFFVLGLIAPAVLRPLNHVWMSFAFVMNFIMTRVILSLVYFLLVTPISLWMRLTNKAVVVDSRERESYWVTYEEQAPATHFEHLYTMSKLSPPGEGETAVQKANIQLSGEQA